MLDRASNQSSKFRTRNWVERNDKSRGTYTGEDIEFKTTMLRSNLCEYANAYILVKGNITIAGNAGPEPDLNAARTAAQLLAARLSDERHKGVTFKNCTPFTKCISTINSTDIDNAQDIDIVMPMYKLIEYSDNYSKISGSLWQYHKDGPNYNIEQSESFKSKTEIIGKTPADGNTKDVIIVLRKYLSSFWRTLEMLLINCEVNLILKLSRDCAITDSIDAGKLAITETKLYVPVVTLSTQDNTKLPQQLKSVFTRTILWNKYESNIKTFAQNRCLNHLTNPSFQGINILFVLLFENENDRTSQSTYYLPKVLQCYD